MLTEMIRVGATTTVLLLLRPWRGSRLRAPTGRPARHHHIPDPFDALRVQIRLRRVADEIGRLHRDTSVFARAARLEASALAYDDLLGRACRLAGLPETTDPVPAAGHHATPIPRRLAGRDLRAHRELLLAEHGWSW